LALGTAGEESVGLGLGRVGGFSERDAGSGRPDLWESGRFSACRTLGFSACGWVLGEGRDARVPAVISGISPGRCALVSGHPLHIYNFFFSAFFFVQCPFFFLKKKL
jgi:hypothetical protein